MLTVFGSYKKDIQEYYKDTFETFRFRKTKEEHKHTILTNLFRHEYINGKNLVYYTSYVINKHIDINYYITTFEKEIERLTEREVYFRNRKERYNDEAIADNYKEAIRSLTERVKNKALENVK